MRIFIGALAPLCAHCWNGMQQVAMPKGDANEMRVEVMCTSYNCEKYGYSVTMINRSMEILDFSTPDGERMREARQEQQALSNMAAH